MHTLINATHALKLTFRRSAIPFISDADRIFLPQLKHNLKFNDSGVEK